MFGGSKSTVIVAKIPNVATKNDVAALFTDAGILKSAGGKDLGVVICLSNAAQLPLDPPAEARLDKATLKARDKALAAVNTAAVKGPKPFFLALLERASEFGLDRDELNNLAFVKKLLKNDDADAIEEAGEIVGKYQNSSSRDAPAQVAALGAFAGHGFARR
mmetsp:Transcript_2703/g.9088  ORF Transcript_2703/g.9088 Transcript_2703/m.9088 type:complete len:162 (+) Transcript_2703:771-1256(+)